LFNYLEYYAVPHLRRFRGCDDGRILPFSLKLFLIRLPVYNIITVLGNLYSPLLQQI